MAEFHGPSGFLALEITHSWVQYGLFHDPNDCIYGGHTYIYIILYIHDIVWTHTCQDTRNCHNSVGWVKMNEHQPINKTGQPLLEMGREGAYGASAMRLAKG
jgi:hypothetical protein